jgi:hypothetical protein
MGSVPTSCAGFTTTSTCASKNSRHEKENQDRLGGLQHRLVQPQDTPMRQQGHADAQTASTDVHTPTENTDVIQKPHSTHLEHEPVLLRDLGLLLGRFALLGLQGRGRRGDRVVALLLPANWAHKQVRPGHEKRTDRESSSIAQGQPANRTTTSGQTFKKQAKERLALGLDEQLRVQVLQERVDLELSLLHKELVAYRMRADQTIQ